MILLDTHVLVWLSMQPDRLGAAAGERLRIETVARQIFVSPISAWETAMLTDKGRLDVGIDVQCWLDSLLSKRGFCIAELTPGIAAQAGVLPGSIHGDPADRIIIATARTLDCSILTADRKILDYAKAGHVQAMNARR